LQINNIIKYMPTLKTLRDEPYSQYLSKLASIESGNNPNARAKTSSASGLFQFTESTWNELNNKYDLGYKLSDRFNPNKSKKMAELLTKENESSLKPILGRELTDGERYLGHFLGRGGSRELLSSYLKNPDEKVGNVVSPGALKSNKSVFLNKDGSQKTVKDVYNWASKKMGVEAQQEQPSTNTIDFLQYNLNLPNFAGVPEQEPQKEETVDKDVAEVEKQTKEQNFLDEIQSLSQQQPVLAQTEQPQQQQSVAVPQADFLQQYNQISQFVDNPVAQQGTEVGKSKEWLQNWYANRQLPDPALNEIYQKEKPLYIAESQKLPDPTYVDKIDDTNTQGLYENGQIKLLNTAEPLVYTHEGAHAINKPLKDTQSSWNAYYEVDKNILPKEKIQDPWVKKNYDELNNYQEVIGRINSYRQLHNLQPDQEITPELIKQNRELYKEGKIPFEDNTDQLYKMFEDEGLSNILNKVVTTNNNTSNIYAQQGGIPTSPNGLYDYPEQPVHVNTTNGRITMKGIDYDVLGIDEFGNKKVMRPEKEYKFAGKNILEIPLFKNK
jgi:hypothetical protein